ncbi:MAG: hypothetical protein MI810_08150 [Flavobacteriales bacterium]|nr:hypothetical protein [Flavobacteriales bacterium]
MRLAQLARKVKVKPVEIRDFLAAEFDLTLENDPNVKIDNAHLDAIMDKFTVKTETVVEEEVQEIEAKEEEMVPETGERQEKESSLSEIETSPEDSLDEQDEEVSTTTVDEILARNEQDETEVEEGEVEEKPFVEAEVDENAELIKAPKVKLEGLKVVGKIDLPQAKQKEEAEANEEVKEIDPFDTDVELPSVEAVEAEIERQEALDKLMDSQEGDDSVLADLEASQQSVSQDIKPGKKVAQKAQEVQENMDDDDETSIYKDKNGNYHFTAQQRANRIKSLSEQKERRRQEELKEKKERHYKEMVKTQAPAPKKKAKKKSASQKKNKVQKEAPKGLWAKFLHWLND